MLEATLNKTFSNEEKRDLKSLILKQGVGSEDLKKFIIKLQKKSPDETVIPDTFLTSFLEVSQNYTFTKESPRKAESGFNFVKTPNKSPRMSRIPVKSPNTSRIPMKSPNGKENRLFVKNQKKIVKPMMGIGSKIPLSNAKMAKKGLSDQNMPKQRHSSPVKFPVNGRLRLRIFPRNF